MYGDHLIVPPWHRWYILVAYWGMIASWVIPRGYVSRLLEQEWLPFSALHAMSLVHQVGIFLSTWTFSVYAFSRPLSLFSIIVYPFGHVLDTLMWCAVFDDASSLVVSSSGSSKDLDLDLHSTDIIAYIVGQSVLSVVIFCHRKTFELWYLPEHHPPPHIRGGAGTGLWSWSYVPAAIVSSFFFSAIYHFYGDLKWCVLLKFVTDVYCCSRMRLPPPWSSSYNEHEQNRGWDWTGF